MYWLAVSAWPCCPAAGRRSTTWTAASSRDWSRTGGSANTTSSAAVSGAGIIMRTILFSLPRNPCRGSRRGSGRRRGSSLRNSSKTSRKRESQTPFNWPRLADSSKLHPETTHSCSGLDGQGGEELRCPSSAGGLLEGVAERDQFGLRPGPAEKGDADGQPEDI